MNYILSDEVLETPLIQNVKMDPFQGKYIIRWNWLEHIEVVLIRIRITNVITKEVIDQIKLFTRDEYKKLPGFEFVKEEYGLTEIEVLGCKLIEGQVIAYKQQDTTNKYTLKVEKVKVFYDIKYSSNYFFNRGTKQAVITIESEIFLPKESICYVKKTGELPLSKEDGIIYSLLDDIYPGKYELPAITVNKNDCVKLFIADIDRFGDVYQLILR